MAGDDEKKDTPTTQPHTPTPPQAQAMNLTAPPAEDAEDDISEDVVSAHQALIKAEQAAGQAQLKANENLAKAQEHLNKVMAKAAGADPDADVFPGYHHKTWAGHDVLQCAYCSWDVVTSSMYNYVERMAEHLAAAHPNWAQLRVVFDAQGNFMEGEVQ